MIVDGESQRAQHDIYHYGESSIFVKVEKNNQYSNLKALEKYQKESLKRCKIGFSDACDFYEVLFYSP